MFIKRFNYRITDIYDIMVASEWALTLEDLVLLEQARNQFARPDDPKQIALINYHLEKSLNRLIRIKENS